MDGEAKGSRRRVEELTPFGQMLRERGITDGEAAEALGVTRQYVNSWACGRATPSLRCAKEVAAWARRIGGEAPVDAWTPVARKPRKAKAKR